jgi:hypothetical protein
MLKILLAERCVARTLAGFAALFKAIRVQTGVPTLHQRTKL